MGMPKSSMVQSLSLPVSPVRICVGREYSKSRNAHAVKIIPHQLHPCRAGRSRITRGITMTDKKIRPGGWTNEGWATTAGPTTAVTCVMRDSLIGAVLSTQTFLLNIADMLDVL